MSRRGPMSIEDHRAWVTKFGKWTPPKSRPGERLVEHVIGQLAAALKLSEAEIIDDVIARADFNGPERAQVEAWARQALTIAVLAAERAGSSGTQLSDNILFHELALRWSPAYSEALERGPGRDPSEMTPETLRAVRDDLKAAGFRLQSLFDKATDGVAGWYETRTTAEGRRVVLRSRPLKGEDLNKARALLGLPSIERVRGHLMRAVDMPRRIYHRIETTDPAILELERVLGRDVLLAIPPPLDSYVLIADAKVTAETEFEPIRSGPRSRAVVDILDQTRVWLDINAARAAIPSSRPIIWAGRSASVTLSSTRFSLGGWAVANPSGAGSSLTSRSPTRGSVCCRTPAARRPFGSIKIAS